MSCVRCGWRGWVALGITLAALAFRLSLALALPNDEADDGRQYAQLAHNLVEHDVFATEEAPPFSPSYARVPGYPLVLGASYALFGHGAHRPVRVLQAVIDTVSCLVVALLALLWAPAGWPLARRRGASLAALALAAACPFTAIYVATILTETLAIFLLVCLALVTSIALRPRARAAPLAWWLLAGVLGGAATMLRPDRGLYSAAAGFTLVLLVVARTVQLGREPRPSGGPRAEHWAALRAGVTAGLLLVAGFAAVLTPWVVRNWRVFGVFQPLTPARSSMPGEFVEYGYYGWLRTWIADERAVETVDWPLGRAPLRIEQFPAEAFDGPAERRRVAALLERYNHPLPAAPAATGAGWCRAAPAVEMTPALDAAFGRLARERQTGHPLRTRLLLPLRRAASLWFDTHSRYYPFSGLLLPLSGLDRQRHQQLWLPLFALLTWAYTLLAGAGGWVLWRAAGTRRWLLLLALLIVPRLVLLARMGNPEARYVVEFFPLVATLGGIAWAARGGTRQADRI